MSVFSVCVFSVEKADKLVLVFGNLTFYGNVTLIRSETKCLTKSLLSQTRIIISHEGFLGMTETNVSFLM